MNTQITNNETMRIGTAEMLNHIKEQISFYQECIYRGCGDREDIIKNTTEDNQSKTDWTKAWSTKYPVLATYQNEVDISCYAKQIRELFTDLQSRYGYSEQDAMLALKDILAHEYMDKRKK